MNHAHLVNDIGVDGQIYLYAIDVLVKLRFKYFVDLFWSARIENLTKPCEQR